MLSRNANLMRRTGGQKDRDGLSATQRVIVFLAEPGGRLTYANTYFQDYTGLLAEDLLGDRWLSLLHPDDRAQAAGRWRHSVAAGDSFEAEYRLRRHDGVWRWFLCSGEPERDEDGRIRRWIGYAFDIEDRKSSAHALPASEADFSDFFENAAIPLHWVGPDGRILHANRAELELLGYSAEEYIGRHIAEFHIDTPAIEDILQRLLNGEAIQDYPARLRRKDGTIRDVLITSNARQEDGKFVHSRCFTRDVTEQRAVEEALSQKTRTLELLSRIGAILTAELDIERLVQLVTDAATELSGAAFGAFFRNVIDENGESYTLYTLTGASREAFARFPMPRNTEVFGPTFRGEAVIRSDDITKDPRYGKNAPNSGMPEGHLPVRSYLAVPVVTRAGEVIGGLFFGHPEPGVFTETREQVVKGIADQAAIAMDNARLYQAAQREIDARKAAEKSLRENEARFRAMADNIPQLAWMAGPDGVFWHNQRWLDFTGTTLEEMAGWGWANLVHPEHVDRVVEGIQRSLDAGEAWEDTFPLRGKDQQFRWFLTRARPIEDAEGKIGLWFGTNTDVTEQRNAEEARLLLAREVNHRAKNTLSVVQSLLRLTPADGDAAKRFARSVSDRIASMARAHELLSKERWTGADLRALAREELAAYETDATEKVLIKGPPLRLAPDVAQAVSMLLHELATNAAKYGALSVPGGRVEVTWTRDQTARGDLRLDWRETGGPRLTPPAQGNRSGFGSRLITVLARQFEGDVHFDWKADGLHCTLRLPGLRLAADEAESSGA